MVCSQGPQAVQSHLEFRYMGGDMRNYLSHNHLQYPCTKISALHNGNGVR